MKQLGAVPRPRPRKYDNEAQQSAAYRERRESLTKRVDRAAVEALVKAVAAAAAAGDPVARQVRTGTVDALLRNLGLFFERRATALAPEQRSDGENEQLRRGRTIRG